MSQNIFIRPPQIGRVNPQPKVDKKNTPIAPGADFQSIFQEQLGKAGEVKFSAHAMKRLEERRINLNQQDIMLLKDAVNRAEAKGAKESLILMDQLALIVSVKNRTVITAVDGESLKENVFTNIDSAVIIKQ